MHVSPALARELAYLLGHAPRREEADRRHALITALQAATEPAS
jgi:hypothetical protein